MLGEKAQSLLAGDHTRTVSVAMPTTGGLMKFAVRTRTCLDCKTPVSHGRAVCDNCLDSLPKLYSERITNLQELEVKFAEFWTQCQRCQGSLHQDVLCTSQDCPIFYMRKKVQKDISDATEVMDRFDFVW